MRYAQEKKGQKLHLVHTLDGEPERRALCGRGAPTGWRLTINLPFSVGMACRSCTRIAA